MAFEDNFGQADDALLENIANGILEVAEERDVEFLGKLVATALSAITQVLHNIEPCNTAPGQECPHQHHIRSILTYTLASGFAHRMYGIAEMVSLLKATATAVSLAVEFHSDGEVERSPGQVLMQSAMEFNPAGWDEAKDSLVQVLKDQREDLETELENTIGAAGSNGDGRFEALSPDDLLDMLSQLAELPVTDEDTPDN